MPHADRLYRNIATDDDASLVDEMHADRSAEINGAAAIPAGEWITSPEHLAEFEARRRTKTIPPNVADFEEGLAALRLKSSAIAAGDARYLAAFDGPDARRLELELHFAGRRDARSAEIADAEKRLNELRDTSERR
jgi:hypothetical protein